MKLEFRCLKILRPFMFRVVKCVVLVSFLDVQPVLAHEGETHYEVDQKNVQFVLRTKANPQINFESLVAGIYAMQLIPCKSQRSSAISWVQKLSPVSLALANHGFHINNPYTIEVGKRMDLMQNNELILATTMLPDFDYCNLRLIIGHVTSGSKEQASGNHSNSDSISWRYRSEIKNSGAIKPGSLSRSVNIGGVKTSMLLEASWDKPKKFEDNNSQVLITISGPDIKTIPANKMLQARAIQRGLLKSMSLK